MGALSHLRVLDLSRVLAGPWAGQILADLGAEVIKVERPGNGDDTRAWGPPFLKDAYGENTTEAAYYLSANRNKESVTIDFTRPEGQKLVRDLAAKSDILFDYRVWPDWALCSSGGLRLHDPGAWRADEPDWPPGG